MSCDEILSIFESCFDENYNYFSKDLRINFEREYPWYNKYNQRYFESLYNYGFSISANGDGFDVFTQIVKHLLLLCCSDPNVLLIELSSIVLNSKECDAKWISNFYKSFGIFFIKHKIVDPKEVGTIANDNKNQQDVYLNCDGGGGHKLKTVYVPNNNINASYEYTIESHRLSCCWYWQLVYCISGSYKNSTSTLRYI